MAQQIIESLTSTGLFNVDTTDLTFLSETGKIADIVTDISGCKDGIIALIDIPAGTECKNSFVFKSAESNRDIEVELTTGKLNVIRFTTKGFKNPDGTGHFQFITDNGIGTYAINAKVAFIKCVDVVNN